MSSDPHNGVNSLDLILMRLCLFMLFMHLFILYICITFRGFSPLSLGVMVSLGFLIVAHPGHFVSFLIQIAQRAMIAHLSPICQGQMCSFQQSRQITRRIKNNREKVDIIFPIISQWGLSVAMETRVLIQSAPKPYAAFPPPQWCYT